MPDQKLSLEDILEEYPSDNSASDDRVGRVDARKIINSTLESPDFSGSKPKRILINDVKDDLFEGARRQPVPADEYKPADLSSPSAAKISSGEVSSVRTGNNTINTIAQATVPVADQSLGGAPMIRRMSDSTRARELEKLKKSKKKQRRKRTDRDYKRETPDGEYMYSPQPIVRKKRSRAAIKRAAESPEGRKHITDIVPSPAAVEAAKPVEPAPRAEKTSLILGERPELSASQLDVHITQETDEFLSMSKKKRRTKRIVDFNYYGDVEDVGRDILELKSIVHVRTFILAMTAFLSLYIVIGNQFSLPMIDFVEKSNVTTYLLSQLILGLISVISSIQVVSNGIKKLLSFKADSDSMTALTSVACIAAAIPAFFCKDLVLQDKIHIYMPVAIIALLLNSVGKMLIIRRAERNFRFVSKSFDRHGIVNVTDEERAERLTRGTLGDFPILASMKKTDFLTDFLRYTYSSDMTDSYCKKAVPLTCLGSALIAAAITFFVKGSFFNMDSAAFGLSLFSMLICVASCVSMPIVVNIPLENIARSAFRNKGMILGYQSVDDFYDTNSVLIDAEKLFPEGTVKLSGIKVFSNTKIDEALLEAASLTAHAGSIMKCLFSDVTAGRDDILYPIENYSYEEGMGMCGWINNKRVLFGSRELMTSHNIEGVPSKASEGESLTDGQEALYLSVSGNLAAMFVVDMSGSKDIKRWARRLCRNKVFLIIKAVDPCITTKKLHKLFGVPEEFMRVLPKKLHEDFDAETKKSVRLSASMASTGNFTSLAQLIIGTKLIHGSAIIGLIIQTISILLGLGLCSLMILSKAFASSYVYMSETAVIAYDLVFALMTYIGVSIKKL